MRHRPNRCDPVEKENFCGRCNMPIAFYRSKRTGKWYPTDVLSEAGIPVSARTWFHKCGEKQTAAR